MRLPPSGRVKSAEKMGEKKNIFNEKKIDFLRLTDVKLFRQVRVN